MIVLHQHVQKNFPIAVVSSGVEGWMLTASALADACPGFSSVKEGPIFRIPPVMMILSLTVGGRDTIIDRLHYCRMQIHMWEKARNNRLKLSAMRIY